MITHVRFIGKDGKAQTIPLTTTPVLFLNRTFYDRRNALEYVVKFIYKPVQSYRMKSIFVLSLILCSLMTLAQEPETLPTIGGKVFYEFMDSVPGINQQQIHSRAVISIANVFKSAKAVTQVNDSDEGEFVGKGLLDWTMPGKLIAQGGFIGFTMRISSRNEKLRVRIYDLEIMNTEYDVLNPIENYQKTVWKKNHKHFVKQVNENVNALHQTILKGINSEDKF
jgi:hypothetical protein